MQRYRGLVVAIRDDMAYLDLETDQGVTFELVWNARELARRGIGERQAFELETRDTDGALECRRIATPPRRLSPELRAEIDALLTAITNASCPRAGT